MRRKFVISSDLFQGFSVELNDENIISMDDIIRNVQIKLINDMKELFVNFDDILGNINEDVFGMDVTGGERKRKTKKRKTRKQTKKQKRKRSSERLQHAAVRRAAGHPCGHT
jgi:hypothetical protein